MLDTSSLYAMIIPWKTKSSKLPSNHRNIPNTICFRIGGYRFMNRKQTHTSPHSISVTRGWCPMPNARRRGYKGEPRWWHYQNTPPIVCGWNTPDCEIVAYPNTRPTSTSARPSLESRQTTLGLTGTPNMPRWFVDGTSDIRIFFNAYCVQRRVLIAWFPAFCIS